jgi:tight adherence protein C
VSVAALVIGVALIGLAVMTIVRALSLPSQRGTDVLDQIGSYGFGSAIDEGPGPDRRTLADVATSLGDALARRRNSPDDHSGLRARLITAGWYSMSPRTFVGYQIMGAVAITAIWLVAGRLGSVAMPIYVVGIAITAVFGWVLPSIVLNRKTEERQRAIDRALPELIDLLVVAVETGMGFVAALRMTLRELDGPLAQELRLTLQEQTMGLSAVEALEDMSKRVQTPAMRSFVRGIAQGEQLGLSLGQILRNLADEMRKRRKAMAEERAQKAPVKMLFPLVLLIFPGMFVVLLLPAIIAIADALGG